MNLPNKLTILRVALIPVFVVFFLGSESWGGWARIVALIVFVIASLTDLLDGKIARKYNLVTNFGKFMDPLADKLLVAAALICFVDMGRIASWIVLIISGFRLVAAESGIVIAASWWGKIKTAVTMVTIIFMLPDFGGAAVHVIEQILVYASLILTVVSLIDYIAKNKKVITGGRM